MPFIPYGLVSGSHVFGVWVLHVVCGIGFFMRCSILYGAMLGSTVDTCSASVLGAFVRILHFSMVKWTRVQSPFSRRMEKCAQPMLQLSVLVAMLALGNQENTSWPM